MTVKPTMTEAELAAWEAALKRGELWSGGWEPCPHYRRYSACNVCRLAYHAAYKRGRKAAAQ